MSRFRGTWRHYQQGCLAAFEADRAAGRDKTLLVAPPGSGKTLVGLEIVQRLGVPALVLCPTQTIQRQWRERQALFGGPSDDFHLLTYQSLCQADDPDGMLRDGGRAALGCASARRPPAQPVDEVVGRGRAAGPGAAAERRAREVAALVARFKRDAAAGKLPDVPAEELLSRERARAARAAGRRAACASSSSTSATTWCRCGARCCGRCSTSCARCTSSA